LFLTDSICYQRMESVFVLAIYMVKILNGLENICCQKKIQSNRYYFSFVLHFKETRYTPRPLAFFNVFRLQWIRELFIIEPNILILYR
jgi:hypothetical protein